MLKRVISILIICLLLTTATTIGAFAQDTTREAVIDSTLEYHHNSITEDDPEALSAAETLRINDTVEPDEEADMPDTIDKKTYCTATLDDDFTDNEIIIVMTKPASIIGREYTTADFAEVDPLSVKTLMFDKNIESDIENLTAQYMESYPEYYAKKMALEEVRKNMITSI